MSGERITVGVVDDSADIALMMRMRIGMEPDLACVWAVTSVGQALERLASGGGASGGAGGGPRVILLDWSMPDVSGPEAIRAIAGAAPGSRVIVFSGYDETSIGDSAWDAGAWRCVSKHAEFDDITRAIREVARAEANG